ncbi:hypothetical protein C8R47DRAFT_1244824 [Mycena vitilis]|nr:hypothetical protein C8R47DRAFT_1244824 [Mycena vitilis]
MNTVDKRHAGSSADVVAEEGARRSRRRARSPTLAWKKEYTIGRCLSVPVFRSNTSTTTEILLARLTVDGGIMYCSFVPLGLSMTRHAGFCASTLIAGGVHLGHEWRAFGRVSRCDSPRLHPTLVAPSPLARAKRDLHHGNDVMASFSPPTSPSWYRSPQPLCATVSAFRRPVPFTIPLDRPPCKFRVADTHCVGRILVASDFHSQAARSSFPGPRSTWRLGPTESPQCNRLIGFTSTALHTRADRGVGLDAEPVSRKPYPRVISLVYAPSQRQYDAPPSPPAVFHAVSDTRPAPSRVESAGAPSVARRLCPMTAIPVPCARPASAPYQFDIHHGNDRTDYILRFCLLVARPWSPADSALRASSARPSRKLRVVCVPLNDVSVVVSLALPFIPRTSSSPTTASRAGRRARSLFPARCPHLTPRRARAALLVHPKESRRGNPPQRSRDISSTG